MAARVSWGIIGTGDVSRSIAADFAANPGSGPMAVASRSAERAREFADSFGFERAYGSVDELLGDPLVDAVYIATPHATHRDLALQALAAGKHVLVEKPLGIDRAQAEEVAAAAGAAGLFAMEAMWMKFNPLYREVVDRVARTAIGEARSLRASFGFPFPTGTGSRWSAELHGSTLLDQGIYPVTFALDLFGAPSRVEASGTVRADGVDLSERITLEFPGGRYAQLAASMVEFADPSASVNGTTGWIGMPWPFWSTTRVELHTLEDPATLFAPQVTERPLEGNGFLPMIRAVEEAILAGRTEHPLHPLSASIAVFEVLDQVRARLFEGVTGS